MAGTELAEVGGDIALFDREALAKHQEVLDHISLVAHVRSAELGNTDAARAQAIEDCLGEVQKPAVGLAAWDYAREKITDPDELTRAKKAVIDNLIKGVTASTYEAARQLNKSETTAGVALALAFLDDDTLPADYVQGEATRIGRGLSQSYIQTGHTREYWGRAANDEQKKDLTVAAATLAVTSLERRVPLDDDSRKQLVEQALALVGSAGTTEERGLIDRALGFAISLIESGQEFHERRGIFRAWARRSDVVRDILAKDIEAFDELLPLYEARADAATSRLAETREAESAAQAEYRQHRIARRTTWTKRGDSKQNWLRDKYGLNEKIQAVREAETEFYSTSGDLINLRSAFLEIGPFIVDNIVALANVEGGFELVQLVADAQQDPEFWHVKRNGYHKAVKDWASGNPREGVTEESLQRTLDLLNQVDPPESE